MTSGQFVLPILLYLVYNANGLPRVDPLVETEIGRIKGLSAPDGDYSMFLGIPYATVNASNPFGSSIPHPGFDSTFEAFDDSAVCPQIEEFTNTVTGTLDCLHLNIYVPNTATSNNRLPVMVWIYGGGFSIGFAGRYLYGPSYLVRHDVIFVTLNYRLGPYGFLCLDTPDVPGNQGLKDQLTALRWVKNNIRAFGGDSDKVTIFGESAGSISVDFHYLYKREEKLFNNIIMQSGTSLSPKAITESNPNFPLRLAQQLGFTASTINEAIEFLTTIDTDFVIAAVEEINVWIGPCVEREFDNVEHFITDHPINVEVGRAESLPVLIGFNSHEGLFRFANKPAQFFETLNTIHDSLIFGFNFENDYLDEMVKVVQQFYMGDNSLNEDVLWDIINFDSDFSFLHPTYRNIQKYSANGVSSIYSYVFSYDGGRNFVKTLQNIAEDGAAHADEIGYLFEGSFFEDVPTSEDQLIIDRITTLWTNFAKYSNPIPEESDLLPIQWPAVTRDSYSFLKIDSDLEVLQRPYHTRMAFWDLFGKLNTVYRKGYREN